MTDEPTEDDPEEPKKKGKSKGKSLVIVESPAKAKTINKYLGNDFVVRASMGHIRDLPKGKFGIDLEHDYTPDYTTIRGKGKVISTINQDGKEAMFVRLEGGKTVSLPMAEWTRKKKPKSKFSYFVIPIKGAIGRDFTATDMKAYLDEATKAKPTVVVLDITATHR